MSRRHRDAEPSCVSLVEAELGDGEFHSRRELKQRLSKLSPAQISASLIWLRRAGAADCVIEPDGQDWWLLTPATDQRVRKIEERVKEEKGSRRRRRPSVVAKITPLADEPIPDREEAFRRGQS